jgi:feruloyl esterase
MNRGLLAVFWLAAWPLTAEAGGADCSKTLEFVLPDVTVSEAEVVRDPVPYCNVKGVIGREINFELKLPEEWNGKLLMGGGGGFVGSVQNVALVYPMIEPLQRGYATVGTDTGHSARGTDASWALNNMERLVNFGHVAVHRTAEVAKAITHLHYGSPSNRNYFFGCSRGGGQALMAAQRYPDDFDGIIAGAPAYDWSAIAAVGLQVSNAMFTDPINPAKAVLTQASLELLESSILAACDADDGLEDRILNDPRQCDFDPAELPRCAGEAPADGCLTSDQLAAIQVIYSGPHDSEGERIYPPYPFGAEATPQGWVPWLVPGEEPVTPDGPTLSYAFSTGIFTYFINQDAGWQRTDEMFVDFSERTELADSVLSATDPDLSAFAASGGKLLMWHGWSDPALSALGTIDYYEQVVAHNPGNEDFARLYMLPGVLHCSGGPGPSVADYLTALEDWVERDVTPQSIDAHFVTAELKPDGGRPLCPYPQSAVYDGEGSDRDPDNFSCSF